MSAARIASIKTIEFLARRHVRARVGHGDSWLNREVAAKRFPQPVLIGKQKRWLSNEVEDYLRAQIAARDIAFTGAGSHRDADAGTEQLQAEGEASAA